MSTGLVCPPPLGCDDSALLRALDAGVVAALAQRWLCVGVAIEQLHADYVRWKGGDGALVGYRVVVRAAAGRRDGYLTVRCASLPRLAAEADRLQHRADEVHDGMRAFAMSPERDVLLLASPIDRMMHDLRWLLRASRVRNLLLTCCPQLVGEGLRISKSRSVGRIVRFKPERRAVVKWDIGLLDEASRAVTPRTVWLRCHAAPQAGRTAIATAAAAAAGVRCPQTLGIAHERLAVERHVEGAAWRPFAGDGSPALATQVGDTLARLHLAERPAGLPVHGAIAELDRALRAVEDLERLSPRLGAAARGIGERLAHEVVADGAMVLAHGDLHPDQILLADDAALVDFDRACLAPAAHDLATLHAHALLQAGDAGAGLADEVARGYRRRQSLPDADELRWWRASALLRAAALPFRQLRSDWPERAGQLLGMAAWQLDAAHREVDDA